MSLDFIRVDPEIGANPKVLDLDDEHYFAAIGIHILAIGYCDSHLTDGRLTKKAVLGRKGFAAGAEEVVDELVRVKLWRTTKDGYEVNDYLEWQRSSADKKAASDRARKAAEKRWLNAPGNADDNATRNAGSNALRNAGSNAGRYAEEREEIEEIDLNSGGPSEFARFVAYLEAKTGTASIAWSERTRLAARKLIDGYGLDESQRRVTAVRDKAPDIELPLLLSRAGTVTLEAEASVPARIGIPVDDTPPPWAVPNG